MAKMGYVYAQTETRQNYKDNKKITSKQWQIYYYLLSISYYDSKNIENHRYVYKKDINIIDITKAIGVSRPTIYSAIKKLFQHRLLKETEEYYFIYTKTWTTINKETLQLLLSFSVGNSKNIDLLRTYLIIKKISEIANNKNDKKFTKKDLVQCLGHNVTDVGEYNNVRSYLAILCYLNLIKLKTYTQSNQGINPYTVYIIDSISEISDKIEEMNINFADMTQTELPKYIYESIEKNEI